jgi:hypothetical protein
VLDGIRKAAGIDDMLQQQHGPRIQTPAVSALPPPHTSAYVSIRQHPSAYVRIRPHTSANVRIDDMLQQQDGPRIQTPAVSALHAPLLLSLTGVCGLKLLVYGALSY